MKELSIPNKTLLWHTSFSEVIAVAELGIVLVKAEGLGWQLTRLTARRTEHGHTR
jgi:hypothetical protein